jgi:hypothetical protein
MDLSLALRDLLQHVQRPNPVLIRGVEADLNINIAGTQRVRFDEFAAGLNFVAH